MQKTKTKRRLNSRIVLDDFKSTYYMEWGRRVLCRTVGLAFVPPLAYFASRRRLARSLRLPLPGMAVLLGAQGALGWYMVGSGLEEPVTNDAVPHRPALWHRAHDLRGYVRQHALRYWRLALRA